MNIHRRQFLAGGLAASAAAPFGCGGPSGGETETRRPARDLSTATQDFPAGGAGVYMNNASQHPVSMQSAQAIQAYARYLAHDLTRSGWSAASEQARAFAGAYRRESKQLFGELINAKASEIAYCQSTTVGENIVFNGMDIQASGGNVVTNDLHYSSCLYNYKMRQKSGLDVRIVKHRDWQLDPEDFKKVVDDKTKLVALTLVSNVNGYLAPVKEISEIAHSRGAHLYADIIQGVGAVPVDVKEMGIDFAAASTYKWLMGLRGHAYLYVREELQGSVVKPTQFGGGVGFNYAPWVSEPDPAKEEIIFRPKTGASQYEVGNSSSVACVCQHDALRYIHRVGVDKIQAHAKTLTDRLYKELPAKGYPSITPEGNRSPIITFQLKDSKDTEERLRKAGIEVTLRFGNQMRVSVSVYNTEEDVERLVRALS